MRGTSASGSASCGTFSSSTMMVMITAITPSLNASSRPLFMRPAIPGLPAYDYQDPGRDRENRHYGAQTRETEIEQRDQPCQDQPDGQQQHADVACEFHWELPRLTASKVGTASPRCRPGKSGERSARAHTMFRCSMPEVTSRFFASLECSLMFRRRSFTESAFLSASS